MDAKISSAAAKAARKLIIEQSHGDLWTFGRTVFSVISPLDFVDAWHLRAIAWVLQQASDGQRARLLINAPPRHYKSYMTSVIYPAYLLGLRPTTKIICASYNEDLALTFARQTRQIMASEIYSQIFPATKLASAVPAAHNLETTQGGYRVATSVGGTLTGLGADYLIVDDPHKTDESPSAAARETAYNWFAGAALTRFDDQKRSVAIVTHQRQHMDDISGRLKAEGGWKSLELPAQAPGLMQVEIGPGKLREFQAGEVLFPERFDEHSLKAVRLEIGEAAYGAQFLQAPVPSTGGLFEFAKIRRFDLPEKINKKNYEALIISVDPGVSTAPGADYTAITIWAIDGPKVMLVYAEQGRWDLPTQIKVLANLHTQVSAILIEGSQSGIGLRDMLRDEGIKTVMTYQPKTDKEVRAQKVAWAIDQGRLWFPKSASFLDMVENQMAAFPYGKNDDLVDSMSQIFCRLELGFKPLFDLSYYKSVLPQVTVTIVGG